MKTAILQQVWEENRKFLMISGAGLVVFLFLQSFCYEYIESADHKYTRYQSNQTDISKLLKDVRDRFHDAQHRHNSYLNIEKDLLKQFSIQPREQLFRGSVELHFNTRIDDIWRAVNRRRTDLSLDCELPEKISTRDLEVRPDDTPADIRRHHIYLEIIRRGLLALVESGMMRVGRPRIYEEESLFIRENSTHQVNYHRISVQAEGSYHSFVRTLRECQRVSDGASGMVQGLLIDLKSKKSGKRDPSLLNGNFEFVAFSIAEINDGDGGGREAPSSILKKLRR